MTWSINAYNLPSATSYEQAVRVWDKGIIFPSNISYDSRGLVDKRKKHFTVRREPNDDIVLRLYYHDTVIWHKDNSFTLGRYPSVSTNQFAYRFVPNGVYPSFNSSDAYVQVGKRKYRIKDTLTFRYHEREGAWAPDEITPWELRVVNRTLANKALRESGYREFAMWVKPYVQMTAQPEIPGPLYDECVLGMLRDRSKWRELAAYFSSLWTDTNRVLGGFRKLIYAKYDCVETKIKPYLEE